MPSSGGLEGSRQLSANARSAISDDANDVVVSAATAWEIATKHRLGKLPQAELVAQDVLVSVPPTVAPSQHTSLPTYVKVGVCASGLLPGQTEIRSIAAV